MMRERAVGLLRKEVQKACQAVLYATMPHRGITYRRRKGQTRTRQGNRGNVTC